MRDFMEIEQRTISYLINFSHGRNTQSTSVVGASGDEDVVKLIRMTFKGRFKRPTALTPKDGVHIVVKKLDHIRHKMSIVTHVKIFNKSVRQARIEVEKAIRISN